MPMPLFLTIPVPLFLLIVAYAYRQAYKVQITWEGRQEALGHFLTYVMTAAAAVALYWLLPRSELPLIATLYLLLTVWAVFGRAETMRKDPI